MVVKVDPATGVVPREVFKELAAMPHGKAKEQIRKYDPQWGLAPGEKFEWEVTVHCDDQGTAIVMAASEEEANQLADELTHDEICWEYNHDLEVFSVEPAKPRA